MSSWSVAFALTHAIEVPLYLALLRLDWTKRAVVAFGTSALTHPYVWFVWPPLLIRPLGYWGYVGFAETFAVVVEMGVCMSFGVKPARAALASLLANLSSFGAGLLLLR